MLPEPFRPHLVAADWSMSGNQPGSAFAVADSVIEEGASWASSHLVASPARCSWAKVLREKPQPSRFM